MGRYTGKSCRLSSMLVLTLGYFIVEIVFGYLSHSMALVADSFHMLSDVLALIVAFFCMKISKKKSAKNTFGWIRAEVLGALVNAVFLLALCFSIFIEALKRLIEPEPVKDPLNILIVGGIGLLVNIIGIFMFHGHASVHGHSHARPVPLCLDDETPPEYKFFSRKAHSISVLASNDNDSAADQCTKENLLNHNNVPLDARTPEEELMTRDTDGTVTIVNGVGKCGANEATDKKQHIASASQLNMHGVFLHILGDAFGSVIVIVNAIIVWKLEYNDDVVRYLDPSLSLIMVLIIVSTTVPLLMESAQILLQTVPSHLNVGDITERLVKSVDGLLAVHEFHVWRLAGNKIIASAHIRCRNMEDYMKIAENVKQIFHDEGIHSTTIQPEFVDVPIDEGIRRHVATSPLDCILECPKNICAPNTCCGPPESERKKSKTVASTTSKKSADIGGSFEVLCEENRNPLNSGATATSMSNRNRNKSEGALLDDCYPASSSANGGQPAKLVSFHRLPEKQEQPVPVVIGYTEDHVVRDQLIRVSIEENSSQSNLRKPLVIEKQELVDLPLAPVTNLNSQTHSSRTDDSSNFKILKSL